MYNDIRQDFFVLHLGYSVINTNRRFFELFLTFLYGMITLDFRFVSSTYQLNKYLTIENILLYVLFKSPKVFYVYFLLTLLAYSHFASYKL